MAPWIIKNYDYTEKEGGNNTEISKHSKLYLIYNRFEVIDT